MDLIDFEKYSVDLMYDTKKQKQKTNLVHQFDDGLLIILITTLHGHVRMGGII